MNPRVKVVRLRTDAKLPRYATENAAGLDLSAALDEPLTLSPRQRTAVGTGIAIQLPHGFEGQVRARSGRALREGLALVNAPGTIDNDYRGEIKVILVNLGDEPIVIQPGDRIAQLVIAPVVHVEIVKVDDLETSARGDGGFGHTGR